ncbi:hypothetical protein BD414DRAFT_472541 [Trametes punicea]|nr:hypothetical protein BD414DRAFT_472541 [Trametes punicea]
MPLVVPLLRLAYVFLNIFDTFKVLRLPPPSARNGGRPSARAMSQRKRAMKGTMTVWMVWACFTLYERWLETIVWLFIPFYSEIKALVIIFFLLTRAKGAEPIFLHILRPAIKPYSGPLDTLFDWLASTGDLLILVASIPLQYTGDYYRRWTSALDPPDVDIRSWHCDTPRGGGRLRAYVSEVNGESRPHVSRDMCTGSMRPTRSAATSGSSSPAHQIWYPPPSAYADEAALNPHSGLPTPPIERQPPPPAPPSGIVDEWRQYPPFPSAYPATPMPATSRLPSAAPSIAAPRPVRPSGAQFSSIEEGSSDEDENANPATRQGFRVSLQLPREPRNPGSDGDLSDENQMKGVQRTQSPEHEHPKADVAHDHVSGVSEMNVDEDNTSVAEDESDFDVTLRTPYPKKHLSPEDMLSDDDMLTPPPSAIAVTLSLDSQVSQLTRSTALSTTDNGSSLRTRTVSTSSIAPSSIEDAPSLAGRKRRLPRYAEDTVKFDVRLSPRKARVASKGALSRASSRAATVNRQRGKTGAKDHPIELDGANADDDSPSDVPAVDTKRQKTAAGRIARPKPQRMDSAQTVRGVPARFALDAPIARPAPSRQPSSRNDRSQVSKKPSTAAMFAASARTARVPAAAVLAGKVKETD